MKRGNLGFTLLELMITVAIISLIASIAYPSYQQYIRKGHRAAALAEIMDISNRQQQFLLANRIYADKAALEANGYSQPSDLINRYNYDVTVGVGAVPSFLITFTAIGLQVSDGGPLTLDNRGVKTPSDLWH